MAPSTVKFWKPFKAVKYGARRYSCCFREARASGGEMSDGRLDALQAYGSTSVALCRTRSFVVVSDPPLALLQSATEEIHVST